MFALHFHRMHIFSLVAALKVNVMQEAEAKNMRQMFFKKRTSRIRSLIPGQVLITAFLDHQYWNI